MRTFTEIVVALALLCSLASAAAPGLELESEYSQDAVELWGAATGTRMLVMEHNYETGCESIYLVVDNLLAFGVECGWPFVRWLR